jgi:hypothetical protein
MHGVPPGAGENGITSYHIRLFEAKKDGKGKTLNGRREE